VKKSTWIIVGIMVLALWWYIKQSQSTSAAGTTGGPSGLSILEAGGNLGNL
jgi:hypothetical protein